MEGIIGGASTSPSFLPTPPLFPPSSLRHNLLRLALSNPPSLAGKPPPSSAGVSTETVSSAPSPSASPSSSSSSSSVGHSASTAPVPPSPPAPAPAAAARKTNHSTRGRTSYAVTRSWLRRWQLRDRLCSSRRGSRRERRMGGGRRCWRRRRLLMYRRRGIRGEERKEKRRGTRCADEKGWVTRAEDAGGGVGMEA